MSHRQPLPPFKPAHVWVLMALAACTHPHLVHAVTLGKFDLKSDRGQVLAAELEIVAAKEDELRTLKIGIAPAQTYRQHWLELHPEIAGTKFLLKRNAQGRYVIQIQGSEPIARPWLDLLLVVSWNDQQRIQEYSVRFPSADSTPDLANALSKLPPLAKLPETKASAAGSIESEKVKPEAVAATPPLSGEVPGASSPTSATLTAVVPAPATQPTPAQVTQAAPTSPPAQVDEPDEADGPSAGLSKLTVQDVPFSDPSPAETNVNLSSLEDMVRIFSTSSQIGSPPAQEAKSPPVGNNQEPSPAGPPLSKDGQASTQAEPTSSVELDKETFATYKQLLAQNKAPETVDSESAQQLQGKIRIETKKRGTTSSRLALSSPADQKLADLAMREQDLENAAIVSSMQKNIDDIKNLQALATSDLNNTPAGAEPSQPVMAGTSTGSANYENTALPVPVTNPSGDQPTALAASGIPNDGGMFGRFRSEIKSVLFAAFIVFIPIFILFRSARSVDQTRKKKGSDRGKSGYQNLRSALRFRRKKDDDEDAFVKEKKPPAPSTKPPTVTDRIGSLDLNLDSPSSTSQSSKAH